MLKRVERTQSQQPGLASPASYILTGFLYSTEWLDIYGSPLMNENQSEKPERKKETNNVDICSLRRKTRTEFLQTTQDTQCNTMDGTAMDVLMSTWGESPQV